MKRSSDGALRMEAAEWLLRLNDDEPDPEEPHGSADARNTAFLGWIMRSAQHVKVFLEIVETHRRLPTVDPQRLIEVQKLLHAQAGVVRLRENLPRVTRLAAATDPKRRRLILSIAASLGILGVAAAWYWLAPGADAYTTAVGEQRQAKLEDGSFVYLNTDSEVSVEFSTTQRHIQLVRGEALFIVEKDSARPFVVSTGNAQVVAVGTQFNVRRRAHGTDVAVIEGVVQVAPLNERSHEHPAVMDTKQLKAGEGAHIAHGQVVSPAAYPAGPPDPVAWRERRLVFREAKLSDVAEEFNRYNRTKIRVYGEAAQDILLTAVFDADRPQALVLYAVKNDALVVEPDGKDWVIRAR